MKIATSEILAKITNQIESQKRMEITASLEFMDGISQWILRANDEDAGTGAWDDLGQCAQSAADAWGIGDWDIEFTEAGQAALESQYTINE